MVVEEKKLANGVERKTNQKREKALEEEKNINILLKSKYILYE